MKLRLAIAVPFLAFAFAAAAASPAACEWYQAACRARAAETSLPGYLFEAFQRGARFYAKTVASWFTFDKPVAGIAGEGISCADIGTRCAPGLVCLNACPKDGGCRVFDKICTKGPDTVLLQPAYAACGSADLCAAGTRCTRTCPLGVSCAIENRCLPEEATAATCTEADTCFEFCGRRGLPPVGAVAMKAACVNGACDCQLQEVEPTLEPSACPAGLDERVVCPSGTVPACTAAGCASGACPSPRLTCLTAPEFGGLCIEDAACARVTCATDAVPFCDADHRCRCRAFEAGTIACASDGECGGISCPEGSVPACASGACACAKTEQKEVACTSASQCTGNCPEGYGLACVEGRCACQRTTQTGPVSCTSVADCGGISCPAEFEKACIQSQCACTRTTTQ